MTAIFISYRRQDTRLIAGRIFDKLEAKFGAGSVFMDIDRIPFGVDFHKFLDEAVALAAEKNAAAARAQCTVAVRKLGNAVDEAASVAGHEHRRGAPFLVRTTTRPVGAFTR